MSNKHPAHCVSEATHVVTVEDRRPFVVNHQCLCTNFMAPEKSYVLEHVAHRRSRTFESRDLFYRAREACRISIALRRHIESFLLFPRKVTCGFYANVVDAPPGKVYRCFHKTPISTWCKCAYPLPPFSMLTQTCDFVECKLFHKKRPLLQLVLVCCTWQHWTRGIGGESLHACLVCWMGVYYENTGLENPMFRNRYAHLLVIEIVVFAPVVSAPRLSTLTLLHLKPPATQPCMKTKVSRMPVLDHGAASRFESMLHHMHSIRGACRCGLGV